MTSRLEPGPPEARDLEILSLLQQRDGSLTDVRLVDGRSLRVWNIAWGYDAGDSYAHITTNCSPFIEGEAIDLFFTESVEFVVAPETGELLLGPGSPPAA